MAPTSVLGATPALGQSWLNPVNGDWNDGTKWSGGVFPNSLATTATLGLGAPYTVSLTLTASAGNLVISNSGASLNILNATTLNLGGGAGFTSSTNNGTILLNSTGLQNATNLAQLGFITRIPGTLKLVSQVITQALKWDTWQCLDATISLRTKGAAAADCSSSRWAIWHLPCWWRGTRERRVQYSRSSSTAAAAPNGKPSTTSSALPLG